MNKDRRVALFIITNALKDPRTEELMAKGDAAAMALSEFPLEFSDATVAKVKEMKEKSKDVKDIDASKINVEVKDKLDAFLQKYGNDSEVMDALRGWLKVIIDVGSKVDVGSKGQDVVPAVMAVSLLPKNELRQLEDVYKKMNKDRRVALFIITNALKDPRTEELMAKGDAAAMALSEFPLEFSDATVAKVKEMKEKSKDVKDIDASKINVEVKDKLDAFLQKYGNDSEVMDALQGWLKVIIDVGSKVDVGSKD